MARNSTNRSTNNIKIHAILQVTPTLSQTNGMKVAPIARNKPHLPAVGIWKYHQVPSRNPTPAPAHPSPDDSGELFVSGTTRTSTAIPVPTGNRMLNHLANPRE